MTYSYLTLIFDLFVFVLLLSFIVAQKFPYLANIIHEGNGRELLQYFGKEYTKHRSVKNRVHWRCRFHYTNCRARLVSCIIDGNIKVNKCDADINHTDHTGKFPRSHEK